MPNPKLPLYLTNFVGRKQQLEELFSLLQHNRLVTLKGLGGIGKTRLVIELMKMIQPLFPDGYYFFDLSHLDSPNQILISILQTFSLKNNDTSNALNLTIKYLGHRQCLLIFDNFEHLITASRDLSTLLSHCPNLKILITSRTPLDIYGEKIYELSPLKIKGDEASGNTLYQEALLLFEHRAKAIQSTFKIEPSNVESIIEICHRLGGLPLAIELAAANIQIFSPIELLSRLDKQLDLLQCPNATNIRHSSLRSAIEWSYDLLNPSEQRFFQTLAIFKNGFTLTAIEKIYTDLPNSSLSPIQGLKILVAKSLVQQKEIRSGEYRFYLVEAIRFLGLELLQKSKNWLIIKKAHATYFVSWAATISPKLKGKNQKIWLEKTQDEVPNLRIVMQWILENKEIDLGLRLGATLWRFWFIRSLREEGLQWFNQLMDLSGKLPTSSILAKALEGIGLLHGQLAVPIEGLDYLKKSLAIWQAYNKPIEAANLMNHISWFAFRFSNYEDAQQYAKQALTIHQQEGYARGIALSYCNLSWISLLKGNLTETLQFISKERPLHKENGDLRNYNYALIRKGWVNLLMGKHEKAKQLFMEAIDHLEQLKEGQLTAFGKHILGKLYFAQNDFKTAYQLYEESEDLFKGTKDSIFIALSYCSKSRAALQLGQLEEAEHLAALAIHIFQKKGESVSRLNECYTTKGILEWKKGNSEIAAQWFTKAIKHNFEKGEKVYLVKNMEWLIKYLVEQEKYQFAIQLWAFCYQFRKQLKLPLSPFEVQNQQKEFCLLQTKFSLSAFNKYAQQGRKMVLNQVVLAILQAMPSNQTAIKPERDVSFLLQLQSILETNLSHEDFNTDELCKSIGMSRSKLHRKIKELAGTSTANYTRSFRMQKAKKLLETTELPIGVIASKVGFKDFSHFSKTFSKEFHKKPSQVRNFKQE